jgi:[ribosomal protein S18]-alanine N-acetyltransferase
MITGYAISLAVSADVQRIAALSRDTIEQGLEWSWTPRRVLKSVADAATNVAVARAGSRFVGFTIMKYADEEAHLLLLAVDAAHRRRGVGSALIAWLEATARVAGIGLISLEARASNTAARAFYNQLGYREVGLLEGYYRGVEDAVRITKDLREQPGQQ